MSKLKLTEWFPATIKPVHEGVYQVYASTWHTPCYAQWMNGKWSWSYHKMSGPFTFTADDRYQKKDWRGLVKKPTRRIELFPSDMYRTEK